MPQPSTSTAEMPQPSTSTAAMSQPSTLTAGNFTCDPIRQVETNVIEEAKVSTVFKRNDIPKRSFEKLLLERVMPKGGIQKPKKKRMNIDVGAAVITSDTYF